MNIESEIRKSIAEEQEAVVAYTQRAEQCDGKLKELFLHLADEERVHVGELEAALDAFNIPRDKEEEGKEEAKLTFTDVAEQLKGVI